MSRGRSHKTVVRSPMLVNPPILIGLWSPRITAPYLLGKEATRADAEGMEEAAANLKLVLLG